MAASNSKTRQNADDGPWLTRAEAAKHARQSVSTIDRAIRDGRLEARRVNGGRAVRTRLRWVDAYVAGGSAVLMLLLDLLLLFNAAALLAAACGHDPCGMHVLLRCFGLEEHVQRSALEELHDLAVV